MRLPLEPEKVVREMGRCYSFVNNFSIRNKKGSSRAAVSIKIIDIHQGLIKEDPCEKLKRNWTRRKRLQGNLDRSKTSLDWWRENVLKEKQFISSQAYINSN